MPASEYDREEPPSLLSTLQLPESPLCLTSDCRHVYSGSDNQIYVFDVNTFAVIKVLHGHTDSVLALQAVPEKDWLLSSAGDGTSRIWDTKHRTFNCLYVIHPFHNNAGDLLSICWVESLRRLYIGCQDSSIIWHDIHDANPNGTATPPVNLECHPFFRNVKPNRSLRQQATIGSAAMSPSTSQDSISSSEIECEYVQICEKAVSISAHYGYVYTLATTTRQLNASSKPQALLISGSGDENVKIWSCLANKLEPIITFTSESDACLTLAIQDSTLFAGYQNGEIKVYDLDMLTCIRTLNAHSSDILALSICDNDVYSCSAKNGVKRWNKSLRCTGKWDAHPGAIVLSSTAACNAGGTMRFICTGGSDKVIRLWNLPHRPHRVKSSADFQERMFRMLSDFVSFKTISNASYREECRQGAGFLRSALSQLGAQSNLLPGADGHNPLVLATFHGKPQSGKHIKRVLFYGHYDVVNTQEDWASDPFVCTGKGEWVYGRGVSDNKGPILAAACAAASLLEEDKLDVDFVMLIEGEEEAQSSGLRDALNRYKKDIGNIDVILVSNSTWVDDKTPALTFGLRGVVHMAVEISSKHQDMHSGVSGGATAEPLVDMTRVLASLFDSNGKIAVKGLYDNVRPLDKMELQMYQTIIERCLAPNGEDHEGILQNLLNRWRSPSLSIHNINVSVSHSTVIPAKTSAAVSIRIVPDQTVEEIRQALVNHLQTTFASFGTTNQIKVSVNNTSPWWLGDLSSPYTAAMVDAVEQQWGIKPVWIREGGSLPSIAYLEEAFGQSVIHLPMGCDSDAAHLPNERMRIKNLNNGKNVVYRWLQMVSRLDQAPDEV